MPEEAPFRFTMPTIEACYEVFRSHWMQVSIILSKPISSRFQKKKVTFDDAQAVINYAAQMVYLIVEESPPSEGMIGRMLELMINENIMDKLQSWSLQVVEYSEDLKRELLRMYELLIAQAKQSVLMHNAMLNPLLRLLMECHECSEKLEDQLVLLLHQLCVSLSRDPMLLEFLFHASPSQGPAKFLLFSLLIPFIHREGKLGMQARDALLLCISVSREAANIGQYIAESTNLCPVLAGGLGGRYSLLPRKLDLSVDHWHCLTREDWQRMPEMVMFLNTLEFCNAVVQVAHPLVGTQLVHFFHDGFLVPIIGPALHQFSVASGNNGESLEDEGPQDEIIAATAYVDLFLRSITEPKLMMVFLRYLCTGWHEGQPLLDSLIRRINSKSGALCRVTLSLFHTFINLNCEDVMVELVLKYLVPCNHIMVSQRKAIKDLDISGKWAEKFLTLTPVCCMNYPPPPAVVDVDKENNRTKTKTSGEADVLANGVLSSVKLTRENRVVLSSADISPRRNGVKGSPTHGKVVSNGPVQNGAGDVMNGNIGTSSVTSDQHDIKDLKSSQVEYLIDAQIGIRACSIACRNWSLPYDGDSPPPVCLSPSPDSDDSMRVTSQLDTTSGQVTSSDSMTGMSSVLSEEFATENSDNLKGNESSKRSPEGNKSSAEISTPRTRSRTFDSSLSATIQEVLDFQIGSTSDSVDTSDIDILELFKDDKAFLDRRQLQKQALSASKSNTNQNTKDLTSSVQQGARPKELKLTPSQHGTGKMSISSDSAFSSGNSPLFEGFGSVSETTQGDGDGSPVAQWLRALGEDSGGANFIDCLSNEMEKDRRLSRPESVRDRDEPCVFWEFDSDLETTPRLAGGTHRRISSEQTSEADRILQALGYAEKASLQQEANAKQMRFSFDVNSATSTPRRIPVTPQPHGLSESPVTGGIVDNDHFSDEVETRRRHISLSSSLDLSGFSELNGTGSSGMASPSAAMSGPSSPAMSTSLSPSKPISPIGKTSGNPSVGPFIDALFKKVENMMQNNLYINLLVTGLVTRLAYYPQPLLRSFLLNTSMVFQPSVRSLVQVLTITRNSLDMHALSVPDFPTNLYKARQYLCTREDEEDPARSRSATSVLDKEQDKEDVRQRSSSSASTKSTSKRTILGDLLRRGNRRKAVTAAEKQKLNTIRESGMIGTGSTSAQYEFLRNNKNAVYCAVVFEEFLKELAALAQEHAVAYVEDS
ncbi:FHF complex subunit HOOK-interacting protein 1B-like isoform X2 [Amphiura filiformis]|uniref:FHF complex subunit HOOK-interacting protein 1B-like isoform X2 n=1 Tax=Amphiura filiformis TaxID=82378 RepID=UPI003B2164F6